MKPQQIKDIDLSTLKPRILVDPDTGERFEVVDGKVLKEVDNG